MDDSRRRLSEAERESLLRIEEKLRQEDFALADLLSHGTRRSWAERLLARMSTGAFLLLGVALLITASALSDLVVLTAALSCVVAAVIRHTKA